MKLLDDCDWLELEALVRLSQSKLELEGRYHHHFEKQNLLIMKQQLDIVTGSSGRAVYSNLLM